MMPMRSVQFQTPGLNSLEFIGQARPSSAAERAALCA